MSCLKKTRITYIQKWRSAGLSLDSIRAGHQHRDATSSDLDPPRKIRTQDLAHLREQAILRQKHDRTKCSSHSLLRSAQCRPKPMRHMAQVMDNLTLTPLLDSLLQYPGPFCHHPCKVCTNLVYNPDLRHGRCTHVKRNFHIARSSQTSSTNNFTIKSLDRRWSMSSTAM